MLTGTAEMTLRPAASAGMRAPSLTGQSSLQQRKLRATAGSQGERARTSCMQGVLGCLSVHWEVAHTSACGFMHGQIWVNLHLCGA